MSIKKQTFEEYMAEKYPGLSQGSVKAVEQPKTEFRSVQEFVDFVVKAVALDLKQKPWFRGVCIDDLGQFYPDRLSEAIEHATDNTVMHDAPMRGA